MRVEIWSDVVCPWCYVGTRRFEQAVERLGAGADDIEVVHRAFELDPTVPAEGMDLAGYLARKFGGADRLHQVRDRLDHAGADVDIDFRWDGKRRVNTFDAHRLTAWALDAAGARTQHALHQRLFRAYFTDNLDVADHGVLGRLAGEVGLDADAAAEVLATGGYAETVRAEELRAAELDIHAVPTFVIEGRWAIPGAQDVDTFAELLERARERLAPLTVGAPSPRPAPSPAGSAGAADTDTDSNTPIATTAPAPSDQLRPTAVGRGGEAMSSIDPSLRSWFRMWNRLPRPRSHGTDCLSTSATRACS